MSLGGTLVKNFVDIPYIIGYNISGDNKMTREFIMLPEFDKQWTSLGFSDHELKALQEELTVNPLLGKVMQGTGGLRKLRFAFENRGKSGSARVCYVDFAVYEKIYLITAYSKNEKDNLSKEERNSIKSLLKALEKTISSSERSNDK